MAGGETCPYEFGTCRKIERLFLILLREVLRATVCGECGNVELSVENPKGLWKTYSKSEKS